MSETVHFSLKTTIKGTSLIFLGMVSGILLWFCSKIFIIRHTTKEELGLYSLSVAIAGILSIIATLGLQEGVARYISILIGEGKKDEAKAIGGDALVIALLSGLCFCSLLFASSSILSRYIFYKTNLQAPLQVIALFIPFSVTAVVMGGILRGHNSFTPKVYADVGQPFFFLAFLSVFFLLKFSFTGIMYAYVLSMIIAFFMIGYYTLHKVQLQPFSLTIRAWNKELVKFSLPVLAISVLAIILGWTDTLMLGRYAKAEDVGIYDVSISLAKLLTFPLNAISFVLMPIAGEMYARKQNAELGRTYQVLTKWIFAITFPVFFILFLFPEMTITFLFGERFLDASMPLRILAICFLLNTFMGANGLLLLVMGLSRILMYVSLYGMVINIGLNYILIKHLGYGVIGASVSTLISYIAINVLIAWILYKRSGIHPLTAKYIKPIIGASIIGLMIYVLAKNMVLYLWMLPLYFLLFLFGYALSIMLTRSIDEEDAFLFTMVMDKLGVPGPMTESLMKFISRTCQ